MRLRLRALLPSPTVSFNVTGFPDPPVIRGVLWESYIQRKARFNFATPGRAIGVLRDYNAGLVWNFSIDGVHLSDPASGEAVDCTLQRGPTAMQPAFGWLATALRIGPNRWQAHPASSFFTQGNDLANIFELLGDDSTSGPIALTLGGSPARPTALTINNNGNNQGLLFDSWRPAPH